MTNSVCTLCCDGCKEHGERVERDRIIALLSEVKTNQEFWAGIDLAIALIKGEK